MPAFTMTAPASVYRERRRRFASRLRRPMVVFSGHAPARNYPANAHVFRAQSSYLYFGGAPVEDAALLIEPGSDGDGGCALFRQPWTSDDEVWMGPGATDADLAAAAGLGESRVLDRASLAAKLAGREAGMIASPDLPTREWGAALGLSAASADELLAVIDLRLCKDPHELAAMRRAAKVNVEAQLAVAKACRRGGTEAQAAAAFFEVLVRHQQQPSFTPIITVHGEVLHSNGYPGRLRDGSLLLSDAGSEEPGGYACDVTRVFPVDGRFTSLQRDLYNAVHRAMDAAIAACVPGARYRDVHFLAAKVLCEGLVAAGLLVGDATALMERRAHTLFFPHGVGHLIGLDVHDMEDFGDLAGYAPGRVRPAEFGSKFLRLDRDLAPGMCVTIEPGIYLTPAIWRLEELTHSLKDVVRFDRVNALLETEFGGIRLEQTVHVREASQGGPEVLSCELPVQAEEVENLLTS
ncbi:MAG: aminopeptidase P N-terminal domain-containing protein [Phycisphaerales bacterium]|nr:aminopeptidase P N-terminal domain-containing protein [Phycisphaerales bacterium]